MSVNEYDVDLYEAIQDLIAEGQLEKGTSAYGIAQQVIHSGYDFLTPKQRTLYDAVVISALRQRGEELRIIQIMSAAL